MDDGDGLEEFITSKPEIELIVEEETNVLSRVIE